MLQHRTVTSPHHQHRHQQQQQQQPGGRSYSAVAARRLATVGGACAVAEPRLDGVSTSFLVCKMIISASIVRQHSTAGCKESITGVELCTSVNHCLCCVATDDPIIIIITQSTL